mgnify:CR=1 FL=1
MHEPPLWPSPEPIWQAAPEAVAAGVSGTEGDGPALSGPWRLLLLGDGSPTRHLQSLTGVAVDVEVIAMEADADPGHEAPAEVNELDRPLLRRPCACPPCARPATWVREQSPAAQPPVQALVQRSPR